VEKTAAPAPDAAAVVADYAQRMLHQAQPAPPVQEKVTATGKFLAGSATLRFARIVPEITLDSAGRN
jgi:hypothetical protein